MRSCDPPDLSKALEIQWRMISGGLKHLQQRKMSVQLCHRPDAHHLFLFMLTDSVNQMFKFHQMLDGQFLRYHEVLGVSSDDYNQLLCGNFGSVVLMGAYKAHLIGADAFSDEVDHVCVW
jgi:hypothetical protein